jgi:alpha-mannosidase
MRSSLILLMVVSASPALSQSKAERLIEAERTECLNREVSRIMQPHFSYSLALVAGIASEAAQVCRDTYTDESALKEQAYKIVYDRLSSDQRTFIDRATKRIFREPRDSGKIK